jgi:phosphoribosylanthranilate isomerase
MDALEGLLEMAQCDHGGSRRCSEFLLSLWNGETFKADMQELLYIDEQPHKDMMEVFQYLYKNNMQLESLVSEQAMKPILAAWGKSGNDFDYSTLEPLKRRADVHSAGGLPRKLSQYAHRSAS